VGSPRLAGARDAACLSERKGDGALDGGMLESKLLLGLLRTLSCPLFAAVNGCGARGGVRARGGVDLCVCCGDATCVCAGCDGGGLSDGAPPSCGV
jgi:hypothetical protein